MSDIPPTPSPPLGRLMQVMNDAPYLPSDSSDDGTFDMRATPEVDNSFTLFGAPSRSGSPGPFSLLEAEQPNSLQNFENTLDAGDPFKLQLGDHTYNIPASLLTNIDSRLAYKLDDLSLDTRTDGCYIFSFKNQTALRVFLYWLYRRDMPSRSHTTPYVDWTIQLVYAWILGSKLAVPDFQDLVMLELLRFSCKDRFTSALITEAVANSPPGCVMQKLMADEMVYLLYEHRTRSVDDELLDDLGKQAGFTGVLAKVVSEYKDVGPYHFVPLPSEVEGSLRWKRFMVAGGPKKHWIHEE